MNLPQYVTKQIAAHDFNGYTIAYVYRNIGRNAKPRIFAAYPMELYLNGPDYFGERHIIVEEKDVMSGEVIRNWTAVVGNGKCHQI